MAKRRAKKGRKRDERLPNGSVIYWSRRFVDRRGRRRVPVRCGHCGQVRRICAKTAYGEDFTGLCYDCAVLRTEDETLDTGSVICWSKRFADGRRADGQIRRRVPVRCGQCAQVREVSAAGAPVLRGTPLSKPDPRGYLFTRGISTVSPTCRVCRGSGRCGKCMCESGVNQLAAGPPCSALPSPGSQKACG